MGWCLHITWLCWSWIIWQEWKLRNCLVKMPIYQKTPFKLGTYQCMLKLWKKTCFLHWFVRLDANLKCKVNFGKDTKVWNKKAMPLKVATSKICGHWRKSTCLGETTQRRNNKYLKNCVLWKEAIFQKLNLFDQLGAAETLYFPYSCYKRRKSPFVG